MKLSIKLSAYLFAIGLSLLLFSCKKEKTDNPSGSSVNRPPLAHAGADITVTRVTCSTAAALNGGGSSDPEHSDLLYQWTQISGPSCSLSNTRLSFVQVTDLQAGQYSFELKVIDASGLSSKDTVAINVNGSPSPAEVNLDVNLDAYYDFVPHGGGLSLQAALVYAALCAAYGQCPPRPPSQTKTTVIKNFDLATWGQFNLKVDETVDSGAANNNHRTLIILSSVDNPGTRVFGQCTVNFKQLIEKGGGAFNGTYQITEGSASLCDRNIFTNLAPLTVSGTLDTARRSVSLNLKGRTYF